MKTETTAIEGEVLDSMPAAQPGRPTSTALATQDNPYMNMALKALEMGKVDQLDKLLDLQMKWDAEQARKAFVAAMADFKVEAGGITIAKSKHVSFTTQKGKTEYDHAELHDITRALVPIMARHGISHSWVPQQEGAKLTITCVMTHRAGHSERTTLSAANDDSGGKNSIQSMASTKTYLERYSLLAATGMATGGELDNDGRDFGKEDPPQIVCITEDQLQILSDLMDAYVANQPKFMDWIRGATKDDGVKTLADIQSTHFDLVHDQLGRIRQQKIEENKAREPKA